MQAGKVLLCKVVEAAMENRLYLGQNRTERKKKWSSPEKQSFISKIRNSPSRSLMKIKLFSKRSRKALSTTLPLNPLSPCGDAKVAIELLQKSCLLAIL